MKQCFKCLIEKEESEFYRHPQMKDGLSGKCKDCTKKDNNLNRNKKLNYYKCYDKERAMLPHRVAARKLYIKCNPHVKNKCQRNYREKFPEKKKAVQFVNNAIRVGLLEKKPCAICGMEKTQGHHYDYSKPLDVIWLCSKHHREIHKKGLD